MSEQDSGKLTDRETKKQNNKNTNNNNNNNNNNRGRQRSNAKPIPPANQRNNNNNIISEDSPARQTRSRSDRRRAAREFEAQWGWDPFERNTTAAMRDESKRQLDLLAKQVEQLRAKGDYTPPLAQLGIGISGSTAKAIRMLVCPEDNPSIPLPEQNPGSLVVGKDLLAQSVSLENGKACVVSSPYGKRQTWISRTSTEDIIVDYHPGNSTYGNPILMASVNAQAAAQPNVFLIEGRNTAAKAATSIAGVSVNNANQVSHQYAAGFKLLYSGGTSHSTEVIFANTMNTSVIVNVSIKSSTISFEDALEVGALYSTTSETLAAGETWRFSGTTGSYGTDATYVTAVPDLIAVGSIYYVISPSLVGTDAAFQSGFQDALVSVAYVPNNVINNGNATVMKSGFYPEAETRLMCFEGYTLSAFSQIQQGNLLTGAKMMAMSTLLSDDAAAINNAGNVVATSMQTGIIPTSGISPISYSSSKNLYNYIGQLKRGSYQIFVPDTKYLSAGNTNDHRVPFLASPNAEVWNMVNWIDCSISGVNDNPPAKLPLRVRTCAVLLTPGLQTFIPSMVTPSDTTFNTALSFLRIHYRPCCNPTHKEEIEQWLQKTFKSAIDYGRSFIKEYGPDLVHGTAKLIQKAAPYVIEGIATL